MTTVPTLNFQDFIAVDHDKLTTDSHLVAKVFGKLHKNVVRSIEALLEKLPADHRLNFEPTIVQVEMPKGATRSDPAYRMTRTGFTLLVMGFTGEPALAFKLAYIDAFDAMAEYVKNQRSSLQYRFLAAELEFKNEMAKVGVHGRALNKWKTTKPELLNEMSEIYAQIQPSLLEQGT